MSDRIYKCEACHGEFEFEPGWNADAEAEIVYRPEELVDAAIVCDECFKQMREALPDMDARYSEQGL